MSTFEIDREKPTVAIDHMEDEKIHRDDVPHTDIQQSAFIHLTKKDTVRKFWRLVLIGAGVCLGGMYVGYCQSATGQIVANPGFIAQFGTVQTPQGPAMDAFHLAMWNGMLYVGQVCFQALSPFVADTFGRKASMYALLVLMLVAIILEIVARDWKVFLVAKICAGAAAAFLGTAIMTYLSEIAPVQIRGALLGGFALAFAIGQLGLAVGLQILFKTNPMAYVNAFYSQLVFFGLFAIVVVLVPESPVWYCIKGRHDKGKRSLRRLVGNVEGYDVDREYAVIQYEVKQSLATASREGESDWSSLFKWRNFKRCIAATLPFSYQNFVGTPLVFGYSAYFFQLAGLADPFLGSLIISIILIVGVVCSFYTVERVGRRTSVLYGGAIMAVVNVAIGAASFAPASEAFGAGLISLCAIWVFVYSLSLAPIGWTAVVEVSSPRLRAKTAAVATVLQSLSNILFSYVIPYLLSPQYAGWGTKIGFFFAGLAAMFWIPCYFLFPETKGRTYAEIDELYASGVPVRKFASARTAAQGVLERDMSNA